MGLLRSHNLRPMLRQHLRGRVQLCSQRWSPQKRMQSNIVKPIRAQTAPNHHLRPSTPVAEHSPTANNSIPGPSWLWIQPLTYPFRAYGRVQARRPYVVQFVSSIIIYFLGDLSSQSIQARTSSSVLDSSSDGAEHTPENLTPSWDPKRALRSITIGAISSIPSYHYFLLLSRSFNVPLRPYLSLTLKVVVNQLTFAPLFNCYFFGMHSLLSSLPLFSDSSSPTPGAPPQGPQPQAAWTRIKETVPVSWWKSCQFWPAVTAFSFTFVPVQHRSVFAGCVAIGWQSYLGLVNQRAVRMEMEAKAALA